MVFMANKLDLIVKILYMNYKFFGYLLVAFIFQFSEIYSQEIKFKKELILKMLDSIDSHNQISFEMFRSERTLKGNYADGKFFAKLQAKPYKIYAKMKSPKEGAEILYLEGENDNKALVNPNSFPYISMSFDPHGSLLKSDGHHTIKEAGFVLFSQMFKSHIKSYGDSFFDFITYDGVYNWNERKCYKITINYINYRLEEYNCKKGETLYDIAENNYINVAKLRFLNPEINDSKELQESQKITITNLYSKKSILYIDKENYFPIYQIIYDEIGLFEKYIYSQLNINTKIKAIEFTRDYQEYDF